MKTEILTNKHEVHILWLCVKKIIEEDIATPAEQGLLMETLSAIADQFKDTTKEYKIKLESKFLKPSWHCLNMALNNGFIKKQTDMTVAILIFEKIAQAIDNETMMGKPVLELVK